MSNLQFFNNEWKTVTLGELETQGLITLGRGHVISKEDIQNFPGSFPVYSSSAQNNGLFGTYGRFMFDEELITWSVDGGGYFFYRPKHKFSVTNVTGYLRADTDKFDYRFLYYSLDLQHSYLSFDYIGKAHPSVIRPLYRIPDIDLSHQRSIADVLAMVDRAIEQTEALLAKYQRIKTGLMQDLLTRGIDERGNLRHPSTHEFKNSPLGSVPIEWEIVTLGEVVAKSRGLMQTGPFGSQLHAHEYTVEGIPVIMPQDMQEDGSISFQQTARISLKRANDLRRHFVKANDVLFARRGDLSRCAPIDKDNIGLCGTGCLLVRIPEGVLSSNWLSLIYKHERCQRQIAAQAVGSTMVNLNTQLLSNLLIAKPSIKEQNRIANTLKKSTNLIETESARVDKLIKIKKGLMQDLLTGKVSIAPLLAKVQEELP